MASSSSSSQFDDPVPRSPPQQQQRKLPPLLLLAAPLAVGLIRKGLRNNPVWRDRLIFGVAAGVVAYFHYIILIGVRKKQSLCLPQFWFAVRGFHGLGARSVLGDVDVRTEEKKP